MSAAFRDLPSTSATPIAWRSSSCHSTALSWRADLSGSRQSSARVLLCSACALGCRSTFAASSCHVRCQAPSGAPGLASRRACRPRRRRQLQLRAAAQSCIPCCRIPPKRLFLRVSLTAFPFCPAARSTVRRGLLFQRPTTRRDFPLTSASAPLATLESLGVLHHDRSRPADRSCAVAEKFTGREFPIGYPFADHRNRHPKVQSDFRLRHHKFTFHV